MGFCDSAKTMKPRAQNVAGMVVVARWRTRSSTVARAELLHHQGRPITLWGTHPGRLSGPPTGRRLFLRSKPVTYGTDVNRSVEYDSSLANLPSGSRRTDARPQGPAAHLCRACKSHLFLIRRHTSPPRLGSLLVTEFYRCDGCDSGYAFSPSTGRWKPWQLED